MDSDSKEREQKKPKTSLSSKAAIFGLLDGYGEVEKRYTGMMINRFAMARMNLVGQYKPEDEMFLRYPKKEGFKDTNQEQNYAAEEIYLGLEKLLQGQIMKEWVDCAIESF